MSLIKKVSSYRFKLLLATSIILFLTISSISFSFNLGSQLTSKYTPLVYASMQIQLKATTAHLWFEEILSGDRSEDINVVKNNIASAIWYAKTMLHGGENEKGHYLPLDNDALELKIEDVLQRLYEFDAITNVRYDAIDKNVGSGSDYDKKYDAVFDGFIAEAQSVENELLGIIQTEQKTYNIMYYVVLSSSLLFIIILAFVLLRYEEEKIKNLLVLEKLSSTDMLTQMSNRMYLEEVFSAEVERAKRYQNEFGVIFLDIDHFKSVNDTYGHDVGDVVLKEMSEIILKNIRKTDVAGRWGGEEFIVVCPETASSGVQIVAEKLRKSIEEYDFTTVGHKTCSFGVSEFLSSDKNEKEVIKRADDALYEAKDSGRNKVVVL